MEVWTMSKSLIILLIAALVVAVVLAMLTGINPMSAAGAGYVLGSALTSVAIAFVLVGIPAGIYWLIKRKPMPGMTIAIWVVWILVELLSFAGSLMRPA
jgi:hypothetical protein